MSRYKETKVSSNAEAVCLGLMMAIMYPTTRAIKRSDRKAHFRFGHLLTQCILSSVDMSLSFKIQYHNQIVFEKNDYMPVNKDFIIFMINEIYGTVTTDDMKYVNGATNNYGVLKAYEKIHDYMTKTKRSMMDMESPAPIKPRLTEEEKGRREERRKEMNDKKRKQLDRYGIVAIKDMNGKKSGNITVIDGPLTTPNELQCSWKCRCVCGSEIVLRGSELRDTKGRKAKVDCGCGGIDLRGKRVNTWVFIGRGKSESRSRTRNWIVECERCKERKEINTTVWKGRYCECINPLSAANMVNKRFGFWTVIRKVDGKKSFLCRCECGKESEVQTGNLVSGHSNGCRSCVAKARYAK